MGFPAYLCEYLVTWIVPFLILHEEGSEILGWFVIATSFSNLADILYSALEAKNYRFMISYAKMGGIPPTLIFLRKSFPILIMHILFIPFAFFMPLIYGANFKNSAFYAVAILLIRLPIIPSRAISSYFVSTSKSFKSFIVYISFLVVFISFMCFSDFQIFSLKWIAAFASAAFSMFFCSLYLLYKDNN